MKVKELIAELKKLDPEMPVFMYIGIDEADGAVAKVRVVKTKRGAQYCQGDSMVLEHFEESKEPVAVLYDETAYWVK